MMRGIPTGRRLIVVVMGAAALVSFFAVLRIVDKPLKAVASERSLLQRQP